MSSRNLLNQTLSHMKLTFLMRFPITIWRFSCKIHFWAVTDWRIVCRIGGLFKSRKKYWNQTARDFNLISFLFNARFLNLFEVVLVLWFTRGEKIAWCPVHSLDIYNIQTPDTQIVGERYFILTQKYLIYTDGMN